VFSKIDNEQDSSTVDPIKGYFEMVIKLLYDVRHSGLTPIFCDFFLTIGVFLKYKSTERTEAKSNLDAARPGATGS
jgi:hypothetical protein